jgi:hypothetical protein
MDGISRGLMINAHKILFGKPQENINLGNLAVHGRLLKWILNKQDVDMRTGLN